MRGDLFGTYSFEQSLHIVEMRENEGIFVTVVRVHVTLLHVLQVLLVVALTIFGGVLRLRTISEIRISIKRRI